MCSCVRVKYREILIVGYEEDEYLLRVKTEHALHIQKEEDHISSIIIGTTLFYVLLMVVRAGMIIINIITIGDNPNLNLNVAVILD